MGSPGNLELELARRKEAVAGSPTSAPTGCCPEKTAWVIFPAQPAARHELEAMVHLDERLAPKMQIGILLAPKVPDTVPSKVAIAATARNGRATQAVRLGKGGEAQGLTTELTTGI